jgi:tetratricopeptide (TPR) repeat protein
VRPVIPWSARRLALGAIASAIALMACGLGASAQTVHANSDDKKWDETFASDPSGAVEQARKLVADGRLPDAIKALSIYVAAHPHEVVPARYLGDLYYRQSDFVAAERTFLAILRYAPDDRETHNRLGGIYAALDRVSDAIDQFQKSLPSVGAYGSLVELHRRRGDLAAFEEQFRREASDHPGDLAAQFDMGSVLRAERRPLDALGYLQHALDLAPHSCVVLSELGSTYLDLNLESEAVSVLERCLSVEPNNYNALVNLGDAYIQESAYERARPIFERAHAIRPDGAEALVDIGYLEDEAQHWQAAVADYLQAIAADPLARDAYVDLGFDYDEHRLFPLAEAAFLKGLSIAPNDGRLHYLLGATYADQGKKALAHGEFQRATASDEPEVVRAAVRYLSS